MTYTCFDVEVKESIGRIHLKRPDQFNSMIREFWRELPEIVNGLDERGDVRVIVITSEGKHFCSGMDLSVFTGGGATQKDEAKKFEHGRQRSLLITNVKKLQDCFSCFEKVRMPVLVALQGGVIGGAIDMISACDMRYCTSDAFFCIQEINIGMTADVGTFPRLPHLIPQGMVREMAYTGRRLPAHRAKEIGLVNEVYDSQEEMIKDVMVIAAEIAAKSPLAVYGSKVMINHARDHSIEEGLDYIALWQAGMYNPQVDMMETFAAKAEKREAVFEDMPPLPKTAI
jgi:enoyl-CoA hydratase